MKYVLTRLAWSLVLVAMSTILVFFVLRVLPSDPVIARLGASTGVDPAVLEKLRIEAGLDKPIWLQYLSWLGGVLHGDFGESYFSQRDVGELVLSRLPATLELTVLSMMTAVALAVPATLLACYRPGSVYDRAIRGLTAIGTSVPPFVVAIMLILVLSVKLGIFPTRGYVPLLEDPVWNLRLMVLPTLTLALVAAPLLIRHLRDSMIEAENMPYVLTAEGKGASRMRVLVHHMLRNSLVPGLTMLGLLVGYTLAGTVVIEYIYGLPGIGSLAVESALKRDYPVLQAVVLVVVVLFVFTTFVVDLLYGVVDPRMRMGRSRG